MSEIETLQAEVASLRDELDAVKASSSGYCIWEGTDQPQEWINKGSSNKSIPLGRFHKADGEYHAGARADCSECAAAEGT